MYQQNLLNFDNQEFDINTLFMFSFEKFKILITSLAKNQNHALQRINDIEDKITSKQKKIEDLEKQLKKQENFIATKFKSITNLAVNNAKRESSNEIPNVNAIMSSSKNLNQIDINTNTNFNQSRAVAREPSVESHDDRRNADYINIRSIKLNEEEGKRRLLLKLSQMEKAITDLENKATVSPNIEKGDKDEKDSDDKGFQGSKRFEHLNSLIEELKKSNDKLTKDFESISIKVEDFNIYDIFKSNLAEGGSADASIILIQNLEKKLFKKFEFIDDKLKKSDEESYRYKNEFSNNKIQFENFTKALNLLKEENEKHNKNGNLLKTLIDEKYTETEAKLKDLNAQINDSILIQLNQLKETQKEEINKVIEETKNHIISTQQNNEDENRSKNETQGMGMSEGDLKMVKECIKKTVEFEKTFKVFVNSVNIDNIKSELVKIHESLNSKLNASDITDVKEMLSQNTSQMNFLKDSISQLLEDRKMMDDINWLRKKVELLSSSMSFMKHIDDGTNTNNNFNNTNNKQNAFDSSKYVDQFSFLDFQKTLFRDLDNLKRFVEELKRYIDDLIDSNKSKADEKDIRNLEEFLNSKIEETKINFAKKFADKTETTKNIKYLDTQMKHIIDSYLKKSEKGDNWLIAKKPVGGFACASCENYIGKLQDSTNQHVPWNKYPHRDSNDKAYRIGNGYSRMLQMLSVDFKRDNTNYPNLAKSFQESDDERSFSNTKMKQDLILPSLKIQNPLNLNISADLIKTDDEKTEEMKMESQRPKIVKIYKRPKNSFNKDIAMSEVNNNLRVSTNNK